MSQPAPAVNPALTLTLTEYLKTAHGKALVASQKLFAYEGWLWQGYNGQCIKVLDYQPTAAEMAECIDMDGCKDAILGRKKSKDAALSKRCAQEIMERDGKEAMSRMEGLKALKLQKELGLEGASSEEILSGMNPQETDDASAEFRLPEGLHPDSTPVPTGQEADVPQDRTQKKLDTLLGAVTTLSDSVGQLVKTLAVQGPQRIEGDHEPLQIEEERDEIYGVTCKLCGDHPPEGHKNPNGWLRGHGMAKHKQRLA